jgi:hypothetical protein
MATIEDIKKPLESKSFTSARDLEEFEERPDDKLDEVHVNRDPMAGIVEKDKHIAELIIVGKIKADIRRTYKSVEDVRIEDSKE